MGKNINRIDHIAYVSEFGTIEANARELERLSGVVLQGPWDSPRGIRIYMSWEAGLEIIAPLPDNDGPFAGRLNDILVKRGEGVFAVIFGVADMETSRERAIELGYAAGSLFTPWGGEPWDGKLTTMIECMISEFMNSMFVYGEIEYNDKAMNG